MNFHFQDEPSMEEQHPGLIEWLQQQTWSDFAQSLARHAAHAGSLSSKQLEAALRMKAKCEAKQAQPEAPTVNHADLLTAFDRAKASGLKYPRIVMGPVSITKASDTSRNPGHLYLKLDGEYAGKVTPGGQLLARNLSPADMLRVVDLLADPADAARTYGKETGQCCCCGRELTNPDSIEAGIGPICAERFGF